MSKRETRTLFATKGETIVTTRADGGRTLSGYAAVFYDPADKGTEYELWAGMKERISPRAFDRALAEKHDVRGLFNHDVNYLLGRTAAGTLRLSTDGKGLRYDIDLADTQAGRDVAAMVERGDLTGSSFSFVAKKTTHEDLGNKERARTIDDVDLFDVGPVTFPAYNAAGGVAVRCAAENIEAARAEIEAAERQADVAAQERKQRVLTI